MNCSVSTIANANIGMVLILNISANEEIIKIKKSKYNLLVFFLPTNFFKSFSLFFKSFKIFIIWLMNN